MITITAPVKLDDLSCDKIKGKYVDDTYYDTLVTEDCDCFREDGTILFKFRKNFVSEERADVGFFAFKNLAKATHARGASAGPIDPNSVYWKKRKIVTMNKGGWTATYVNVSGSVSGMKIQNEVASNIVGYWSETKQLGLNMPCRLSNYSRQQFLKVEDGGDYIQAISNSYKQLHPELYEKQMKQAQIQPDMLVGDTPFSTITINRNFRTAVHKDAGDYGFGNLSVLEYGHYHGGYFVIPKYRIAIDMRSGDHLCVDVHEYHANTALYETEEDKLLNDELPDIYNDNLNVGVLGLNDRKYTRISLVCYLRGALKNCEMELDPELMKPIQPAPSKITILFVNKLKERENRKKFLNTNWSRCDTHETALHRIIKHQMNNVIIIDDTCTLNVAKIGNAKQFPNTDGPTFILKEPDKLAYFVPNYSVAIKLLCEQTCPFPTYHSDNKIFV
tara:strand:- start:107 stop:1444 length:1338 start_codon:yes stop_codon:yes gene_type:complete